MSVIILGIESSCDDTSAAVIRDGILLSNVIASQKVHEEYGGVVPELASRAHQQNIVPVVDAALKRAGVDKCSLSAIAFTRGPGLLGVVAGRHIVCQGTFVGGYVCRLLMSTICMAMCCRILSERMKMVKCRSILSCVCLYREATRSLSWCVVGDDMEVLGQTIDDAAGEAFDKCAKVIGLPLSWRASYRPSGRRRRSFPFSNLQSRIYKDWTIVSVGFKTSFLYTFARCR